MGEQAEGNQFNLNGFVFHFKGTFRPDVRIGKVPLTSPRKFSTFEQIFVRRTAEVGKAV